MNNPIPDSTFSYHSEEHTPSHIKLTTSAKGDVQIEIRVADEAYDFEDLAGVVAREYLKAAYELERRGIQVAGDPECQAKDMYWEMVSRESQSSED